MSIHPSAVISPAARIHPSSHIGPFTVIDGEVEIGPECHIGPSVTILGPTEIAAGCRIHSHSAIGDVPQDLKYTGGHSCCRIGEGSVIREGVTIHRASLEGRATIVGKSCLLMTNSHVGHDCVLGDGVMLVSGALLGGHTTIGNNAIISGNAAVHQFVRIGELAMVGGLAKVVQDIPPFMMTDREGSVIGLNAVGLVRSGYPRDQREEIKAIFKIIYRSGMSFRPAIELARELACTDPGKRLVDFVAAESKRGIRKGPERIH